MRELSLILVKSNSSSFTLINTPTSPTIPPLITPTYSFPTQTIAWNSGQQTAISSWYTVVGNIPGYTWGQNIPFTTGGQGNPSVQTSNGTRQANGNFLGGLNVLLNVPPRGESFTGYVYIGTSRSTGIGTGTWISILAFTVKRDPMPPLYSTSSKYLYLYTIFLNYNLFYL